jgi:hypothetical protein
MQMPKKATSGPKRFNSETVSPLWTKNVRSGSADLGLHDDEMAIKFAALVTEFVYLERAMEVVFSRLLGTDNLTATQLCQKVISPTTRVQMMRTLLHHGRQNATKSSVYDEIIDEFQAVSLLRNQYVHGLWETADDGRIYLVRPRDDPYALGTLVAKRFDPDEMAGTRMRIIELMQRIYRDIPVSEGAIDEEAG